MLSFIFMSVAFYLLLCWASELHYAECHYAECYYAECHYAECYCAECHHADGNYAECHYAESHYVEYHFDECNCVECLYSEGHYAECRYTKCHCSECRYIKRRGANICSLFWKHSLLLEVCKVCSYFFVKNVVNFYLYFLFKLVGWVNYHTRHLYKIFLIPPGFWISSGC
jgi:hypothetical protein